MNKIPWSRVKEFYGGEWIELVDFDWPWNRSTPLWGRVRHHAADRSDLMKKIAADPSKNEAVIMFVGTQHAFVRHFEAVA